MIIGGFIVKVQTLRDVPFWYEGGVFGMVLYLALGRLFTRSYGKVAGLGMEET
jgi:hypothetical protein